MSEKDLSTTTENNASPKSTIDYWEKDWLNFAISDPIDPNDARSKNYYYRVLHKYFERYLTDTNLIKSSGSISMIEIGCGGSRWLPYFKQRFGFEITGIDYSTTGCESAIAILSKAGVSGKIIKGNLFIDLGELHDTFDVVASFGFVEHFRHTDECLRVCARFLKPNGIMITAVPNMAGLYGWLYKIFYPNVYKMHLPLTSRELAIGHESIGLKVLSCDYILGFPGVLDPTKEKKNNKLAYGLKKILHLASSVYWTLEERGLGILPNAITSPYILCISKKQVV